jgi:hypothetical protein
MDSIPDDLLELQARFDQWRANRKYNREPIPDQLRDAALEMNRRYPPSLLRRVLKIQLCRLMPKTKTRAPIKTTTSPNRFLQVAAAGSFARRRIFGSLNFDCLSSAT